MKDAQELSGLSTVVADMLGRRLDDINRKLEDLVPRRELEAMGRRIEEMLPRAEAELKYERLSEKVDDLRGDMSVNHRENSERLDGIKQKQEESVANRLPKWFWPVLTVGAPTLAVIIAHYVK